MRGKGRSYAGSRENPSPRLAVEQVPISSLKPDPGNARRHSVKQIRQIASSIAAFGFNAPVLVDEDLNVIAGHGRLKAAKRLGLTHAPVVRLSHLNEPERKAFAIADNRLAEAARWDERRLAVTLKGLSEAELNFDIEAIGFDLGEIELKIDGLEAAPAAPDGAPSSGRLRPPPSPASGRRDAAEAAVSWAGDAWLIGPHRVLCGEATGEEADALIAAPEPALAVFGDPAAADALVRRFEASTGGPARLAATGQTFAAVCARRNPHPALRATPGSKPGGRALLP